MANPKFKFKDLTRTDLLQYDGENFVNVPVYTIRNEISSSSQPTTPYTRSDVQWGQSTDVFAVLTIGQDSKRLSLDGHTHTVLDIENLEAILNSKMDQSDLSEMFIRKDISDFANGHITFNSGLTSKGVTMLDDGFSIGNHGISKDGDADLRNITIHAGIQSPAFTPGFLGEGFKFWLDELGESRLELDHLTVRKNMDVFQLTINKIQHVGGAFLFSPASIVVGRVEELTDVYRCYIQEAVAAEGQDNKNLLLDSHKLFMTGTNRSSLVTLSNTSSSGRIDITGNHVDGFEAFRVDLQNDATSDFIHDYDEEYTLSVDVRASFQNLDTSWVFEFDTRSPEEYSSSSEFGDTDGEWVRISTTITIPDNPSATSSRITFSATGDNMVPGDFIEYRNFKLERNFTDTLYEIAPEENYPSINNFVAFDQAICQTFANNSTKRYWRLVTNVANDHSYIDLSKNDSESGSDIPEVGDVIVQLGHRSNIDRQNAVLISSYGIEGPYQQFLKGVDSFSLVDKIKIQIGKETFFHEVESFSIQTGDGTSYRVPVDRGAWSPGTYYYYDRVSHNGSLWLMVAQPSTTLEPQEGSPAWEEQVSKGPPGPAGEDGAASPLLYLSSSSNAMTFDINNDPYPVSQTISIEAKLQNIIGVAGFTATPYIGDVAQPNITLGGVGNSRTLTQAQWNPNFDRIVITATLGSLTDTTTIVKLTDGGKGEDGKSPVVGYLTNESASLPASSTGAVSNFSGASGSFKVYEGLIDVTSLSTFTRISQVNCTATINSSGDYSVSAMTADNATVVFRATYSGVLIDKVLTLSKSKQGPDGEDGEDGEDGASAPLLYLSATGESMTFNSDGSTPNPSTQQITFVANLTNISGNPTFTATRYNGNTAAGSATLTGSGISRTLAQSQFLAATTRIVIQASLGDLTDTVTVVKLTHGATGSSGRGISSDSIQYTSSASGTITPTTGWQNNIPAVPVGNFLWTRHTINYTDSTTSIAYSVARQGQTGSSGQDGTGISSTEIRYAGSTSGVTAPTTGWQASVPSVAAGSFLWTRTVTSYTDSTSSTSYSVSRMGENGTDGESSFSMILTNESHSYPASSIGVVNSTDMAAGASQLKVWHGHTLLTCDNVGTSNPTVNNTYRVISRLAVGINLNANTIVGGQYQINPSSFPTANSTATVTLTVMARVDGLLYNLGTKTISYSKSPAGPTGLSGADAQLLSLSADSQVFLIPKTGSIDPSEILITLKRQNITGSVTWTSTPNVTLISSGDNRRLTAANMGANKKVTITASSGGFSDSITIVKVTDGSDGSSGADGESAFTLFLTNESHTYPADSDGNVLGGLAPGYSQLRVYYQSTLLTCDSISTAAPTVNNTYRVTSRVSPTPSIPSSATVTSSQYEVRPTSFPAANLTGSIILTIVARVNNKNYTFTGKTISYSKSPTGDKGDKGDKGDPGEKGIDLSVGKKVYGDPTFIGSYNYLTVYNNGSTGNPTLSRRYAFADSPTTSEFIIRWNTPGSGSPTPGRGGFTFSTLSRANARFYIRMIMKVPTGVTVNFASNSTGTGGNRKQRWLSSNSGTGEYEEYIFENICGNSGTFSSTNFFYFNGSTSNFNVDIAYAEVFDLTDDEQANSENVNKGNILTRSWDYDITNILTNSSSYPITKTELNEGNRRYIRIRRSNTASNPTTLSLYNSIVVTPGGANNRLTHPIRSKKVTISFEARGSINTTANLWCAAVVGANPPMHNQVVNLTTSWKRYYVTFTVASTESTLRVLLGTFNMQGQVDTFYVDFSRWQVKFGAVYDAWEENENDVIDELFSTGIDIRENKITLTANTTTFRNNNGQEVAVFNPGWTSINANAINLTGTDNISIKINETIDVTTGNLLNNPAVSGTADRWSSPTISNEIFQGYSTPVLNGTNSANVTYSSSYFKVDPSKAYEVSAWFKRPSGQATGTHTYLGTNQLNSAGSTIGLIQISNASGVISNSNNTNFYFWSTSSQSALSDWYKIVAYIMPSGTNPADMIGIGENTSSNAIMRPDTDRIRIRFLNWSNGSVTRTLLVANPKVQEVDPRSVIRITGLKTGLSGTGINIDANTLTLYSGAQGGSAGGKIVIAGANFSVDGSGNLKATNADLTGKITATSGAIGPFTIDLNSMYSGTKQSSNAYTANASSITIMANAIRTNNFRVDTTGSIYLANASVTGILSAGSGNNIAGMGISGSYRLWAGNANPANAPFNVSQTGAIKATAGTLGNWTIDTLGLYTNVGGTNGGRLLVNQSGGRFLQVNDSTDRLMYIRADGGTGLYIYTQSSSGTALNIIAQTGSTAITSRGSVNLIQRAGETWTSPGVLGAINFTIGNYTNAYSWSVRGVTLSISNITSNNFRLNHNLGHTDYIVIPSVSGRDAYAGMGTRTANYCIINRAYIDSGHNIYLVLIGRNKNL